MNPVKARHQNMGDRSKRAIAHVIDKTIVTINGSRNRETINSIPMTPCDNILTIPFIAIPPYTYCITDRFPVVYLYQFS